MITLESLRTQHAEAVKAKEQLLAQANFAQGQISLLEQLIAQFSPETETMPEESPP